MSKLKKIGVFFGLFAAVFIYLCLKEPSTLLQFRTCQDEYHWWAFCDSSREGLDTLNISGSGVIHLNALKKSLGSVKNLADNVVIVNLSINDQYYADGRPFRWYNWYLQDQDQKLIHAPYRSCKNIHRVKDNIKWFLRRNYYHQSPPEIIESEGEMIKRLGYGFKSFHIVRRQLYKPHMIDEFVEFIDQLPAGTHLHFHCDGGNSRTTTLMTMVDIIKNGTMVSLNTIIERQRGIGGVNLYDTKPYLGGTWKPNLLEARLQMVEDFYRYVNDPNGYGHCKWSEWLEKQPATYLDLL